MNPPRHVVRCASALLALSAVAPAQGGGTITLLPNTCVGAGLSCGGAPTPGGAVLWEIDLGLTQSGAAYLLVDLGGPSWNGAPVPQPLPSSLPTLAGCSQLAAADLVLPMQLGGYQIVCGLNPNGTFQWCWYFQWVLYWQVPHVQALLGWSFRTQAVQFDAAGAPSISDGYAVTVG